MTNDAPEQHTPATRDAPRFPHQDAGPHLPLEATEQQDAEPPGGVPRWQPDEGDFS
jgi:hypothetical protein